MLRAWLTRIKALMAAVAMLALSGGTPGEAAENLNVLNWLVFQIGNQGRYQEAAVIAERALALAESTLGKEHPTTLMCINNLAYLRQRQARYDEAEQLFRRGIEISERTLGRDDHRTIAAVSNLGLLLHEQGRYAEAEPLYIRSLETRERMLGREHEETLLSVNNLAGLYSDRGRYGEAEPLCRRAVEGFERRLGRDHRSTLTAVSNLGLLLHDLGRYSEAEPLYDRALAGRERRLGQDHPETLISVTNLAGLYQAKGRYREAERLYLRAMQARERVLGTEHPDTLQAVHNLAGLYGAQGRHDQAETLYRRALEARERVLPPDHPHTLLSLNRLAATYETQGRYAEAEPLYRRALEARERVLGREHPNTLTTVNNLAGLYLWQGRFGEAEPLYVRALEASERVRGREHPETLISLGNLAFLYQQQGRYGKAEPLHRRALEGKERVLGREHPTTLISVNNLAALYFAQSDWSRAAALWRRSTAALADRTRRSAEDLGLTGQKENEATQWRSQFLGLVKAVYRLAPKGRQRDETSREMFKVAQWALGSEAAQSLAQMAARGASGNPALAPLVRERQDKDAEWQKRNALRDAAFGRPPAQRDRKAEAENLTQLAAADRRIAEIDARLASEFPKYAALASQAPVSVEEVRAQLGADEVLVLFFDTIQAEQTPEETFIWVVTRTDIRWLRSDLGSIALIREVGALRCGLDYTLWTDPDNWPSATEEERQKKAKQAERAKRCAALTGATYTAADESFRNPLPFDAGRAHRLYKALLGGAEDLIAGKHLLLVPSGALTQLPFQVLITQPPPNGDPKAAAWLARSHALTVLPAVSSLKALRSLDRPSAATRPLIGFGNPLLDGPDARFAKRAERARERQGCPLSPSPSPVQPAAAPSGPQGGGVTPIDTRGGLADVSAVRRLVPLHETADELCDVARDIGADVGEVYLGARATERAVKKLSEDGKLASYRVLHFATHGAMAGQMKGSGEPGLVLTPPAAASEDDDGYLSASEIAVLKLDADLVILSACNTAAGEAANAEALSGLARAFIYAQARALLVSHWEVDSVATVKLINATMRAIAQDRTVGRAEALRRAMLSLIDTGISRQAHPAYWAPFIVVGEGARS